MPIGRAAAVGLALIVSVTSAEAQHSPSGPDSARAQIHRTLRAFYFNLAHHDWEALTADILAAKVVAHRPVPEAPVIAANRVDCSSTAAALVAQSAIVLNGDWAEVRVPRCTRASSGMDEFRLISFGERWRIVTIKLFQDPLNVSADR
jgi:hypothetical protein